MLIRNFLVVIWSLGLWVPAAEKPNILFIFTDDQAIFTVSSSGHPHAKTPHMDRLAREGANLVNSFTVTPVCSPSRASLMTSKYGTELGITDWIHPRNEPDLGLDPKVLTFPPVLKQAGYATGLVGKWHLGLHDHQHPTKFGFDYFMGSRFGGFKNVNPELEIEGKNQTFKGLTADIFADYAIKFLEKHREDTFFLAVHHRAPHTRWLPVSDDDWAPYKDLSDANTVIPNPAYPGLDVARVKRMTREYLASVRSVDRNLGRLLATLDTLNLANNTVVIFSSDHGYNMGHNGIWHKGNGHWVTKPPPPVIHPNVPKGQRPNMYDLSVKVPTFIRWPGVIKPGTVIRQTISNLDWFPTFCSIAGVSIPGGLRGRSIVPVLRGEEISWNNDYFGQYSTRHQSKTHMRCYRTERYKLIRDFLNPKRDEFYDLMKDPAEAKNLIGDPESRVLIKRLHAKLLAEMKNIDDPVL
jgi:choline-sulfatase